MPCSFAVHKLEITRSEWFMNTGTNVFALMFNSYRLQAFPESPGLSHPQSGGGQPSAPGHSQHWG